MYVWMYKYKSSVKLSISKSDRIIPEMKSNTKLDGFRGFHWTTFQTLPFFHLRLSDTEWVHNTKCSYFNHSLCKQTFENIFSDERAISSSYLGIIETISVWDWVCVTVTAANRFYWSFAHSGLGLTSRLSSLPGKAFSKWRPFEIFYEQYIIYNGLWIFKFRHTKQQLVKKYTILVDFIYLCT